MKRDSLITLMIGAALIVGVAFLPACGSGSGVREAQAARTGEETDDLAAYDGATQDETTAEADSYEPPPAATPTPAPKPAQKPAAKPVAKAPAPTQAPVPVRTTRLTVPAFTQVDVEFVDALSSESSQVGDSFTARLAQDVVVEGQVAIPAGSVVSGQVVEVVPTKKIGGQARLALQFNTLRLPSGDTSPFHASFAGEGKKQTTKDAATIGGSAAGGALLGRVLSKDRKRGTAVGAVVGAAVGTAVAAGNEGDPVNIDAGIILPITIQDAMVVVFDGERRRFEGTTAAR